MMPAPLSPAFLRDAPTLKLKSNASSSGTTRGEGADGLGPLGLLGQPPREALPQGRVGWTPPLPGYPLRSLGGTGMQGLKAGGPS